MVSNTNPTSSSGGNPVLSWSDTAQEENDRAWLASIKESYAQFSDAWTKAYIIELAYRNGSVVDIISNLTKSAKQNDNYPDLHQKVNDRYVCDVIASWQDRQFSQKVGRNFEIYTDRYNPNVFLVASTAPVSLNVKRDLPNPSRFRPLFNVDELARLISEGNFTSLTLRTHGFANPAKSFYESFVNEANELSKDNILGADRLYIGYHWPSEQPFFSKSLSSDVIANLDALAKFLFVLSGMSGIVGFALYSLLHLIIVPILHIFRVPLVWPWRNFNAVVELAVHWYWLIPTTFLFWLLAFWLLRLFVYHRDRYRAIHYGAPDLAEFFWRLDSALSKTKQKLKTNILKVNLIGHSMGGLLLTNMLRVLSDKFGKDDVGLCPPDFRLVNPAGTPHDEIQAENRVGVDWQLQEIPCLDESQDISRLGDHLDLMKIILASPDIPLEFLRESRNNYVRSAISRCDQIFLMSSDRDIVLRYLSAAINWFSEPSIEMSAARLGNVHLKANKERVSISLGNSYPYIRVFLGLEPAVKSTSAYSLFQKFNYLDCTQMKVSGKGGVNGVSCPLNPINGILIDIFNTLLYALQKWTKIDLHGGYFQTNTPSFELLKLLISFEGSKTDLHAEIGNTIRNQQSNILYLPSHDWHMP
jgi:Alpha/beta hydrolase of unknown function (DUF900)